QSRRICEKVLFGAIINLADQLDLRAIDLRFKPLLEIGSFASGHLGRYPKRHPRRLRDTDCDFRTFFGRKSAEKSKVRTAFEHGPESIGGQPMIYSAEPIRLAKR